MDILDLIREAVFARDLSGRITSWNAASETLYGWSEAEAIGQVAGALLHCVDQPRHEDPRGTAIATGQWQGEVERRTKSGEARLILVKWRLYRDPSGNPTHIIETSLDITEQRAAAEELDRSEFRYRNLFQAMAVAFWELDFTAVADMLRDLKRQGITDFARHFEERPEIAAVGSLPAPSACWQYRPRQLRSTS